MISFLIKKKMFPQLPQPTKYFQYEADFQTWFSGEIKALYWAIPQHKISDMSRNEKPCDYFFFDEKGRTFFCELKVLDGYTLNINRFEPQQVEFMTALASRCRHLLQQIPLERKTAEDVDLLHSLPYAVLYCQKTREVKYLPWWTLQDELLQKGSVKVFEPWKSFKRTV